MSTCYYPAHSLLPAWDRSVFIRLLRDALDALPIGAQAGAGLVICLKPQARHAQ